jgi:hypothetical protein
MLSTARRVFGSASGMDERLYLRHQAAGGVKMRAPGSLTPRRWHPWKVSGSRTTEFVRGSTVRF